MKRLLNCANLYLKKSSWKDLAAIKLCVFSVGVLVGTYISGEVRGYARIIAIICFIITSIPILIKLFGIIKGK